jgi:hypothetical protein
MHNRQLSSPADVHTNLNGALTKASVTKALDKLAEQDLAISKVYGKSVIYSIAQVKRRTKRSSNAFIGCGMLKARLNDAGRYRRCFTGGTWTTRQPN